MLQIAANNKGLSDLLETIYYDANHSAHSGRDFNISPWLSAMDSGEEKMHRETSNHSYKHGECLTKETRGAETFLLHCVSLFYADSVLCLTCDVCEWSLEFFMEAGGTVEGVLSYEQRL